MSEYSGPKTRLFGSLDPLGLEFRGVSNDCGMAALGIGFRVEGLGCIDVRF